MGHVFVKAMLEGVKGQEEADMLVDTGATLSTIPEDLAQRLGVPKLKPKRAQLADGRELIVEAGTVQIKINGREAPTTVLIMGNELLLGVETLETLGLKVNPQTRTLEPTRSFVLRL
jgi:clan AA aspartic protease